MSVDADTVMDRAEVRHTIASVRSFPELPGWVAYPDDDPAHAMVVRQWREHRSMRSLTKPWRQEPALLDYAVIFLAEEDEKLAAVWDAATSDPVWTRLQQSDRDYYTAAHALAAEHGQRGGRRVQLSNRVAQALIRSVTGNEYRSGKTITNARERLIALGWITAEVGSPFTPGVWSKATVIDLLPASPLTQSHFPRQGLSKGEDPTGLHSECIPRPKLNDIDRQALTETVTDCRRAKAGLGPVPESLRAKRPVSRDSGGGTMHMNMKLRELREQVDRLRAEREIDARRISTLTGQVDGLQAQVTALTEPDEEPGRWTFEDLERLGRKAGLE